MGGPNMAKTKFIRWLKDLHKEDIVMVGGKGASLGEMISNLSEAGVLVPGGFVVTTDGWRRFA